MGATEEQAAMTAALMKRITALERSVSRSTRLDDLESAYTGLVAADVDLDTRIDDLESDYTGLVAADVDLDSRLDAFDTVDVAPNPAASKYDCGTATTQLALNKRCNDVINSVANGNITPSPNTDPSVDGDRFTLDVDGVITAVFEVDSAGSFDWAHIGDGWSGTISGARYLGPEQASGFVVTEYRAWQSGNSLAFRVEFTRSGATIAGDSAGNITNTLVCTMPTAQRGLLTWGQNLSSGSVGPGVFGYFTATSGVVYATATATSAGLVSGSSYSLGGTVIL